jgi:aspartate aminotransferase-like enzyme
MIPPGLGLVTISPRAWERVKKSTHPKYYFSWEKAQKSMVAEELADTPYTPNISLILQISEAIRLIEKEGLEKVWERHKKMASATRAGLQGLGVKLYASDQPSNAVTSAWVPEGVDGGKMVKSIRDTYGITLAGGQGKAKGKIFRVGHLGYADDWDVVATIAAIERALQDQNFSFTLGQGVAAAEKVLFQK